MPKLAARITKKGWKDASFIIGVVIGGLAIFNAIASISNFDLAPIHQSIYQIYQDHSQRAISWVAENMFDGGATFPDWPAQASVLYIVFVSIYIRATMFAFGHARKSIRAQTHGRFDQAALVFSTLAAPIAAIYAFAFPYLREFLVGATAFVATISMFSSARHLIAPSDVGDSDSLDLYMGYYLWGALASTCVLLTSNFLY